MPSWQNPTQSVASLMTNSFPKLNNTKNGFNNLTLSCAGFYCQITLMFSLESSTTWKCVGHMGDNQTALNEWMIDCSFSRHFFIWCSPRRDVNAPLWKGHSPPQWQSRAPHPRAIAHDSVLLRETSKGRQDRPGTQKPASHLLLMPQTAKCQNESLLWAVRLMWPFIDRRRRLGMLKGEGFYALLLILSGTLQSCHVPHTW